MPPEKKPKASAAASRPPNVDAMQAYQPIRLKRKVALRGGGAERCWPEVLGGVPDACMSYAN